MTGIVAILLVLIVGVYALAEAGVGAAVVTVCILSPLVFISWYFWVRRTKAPTEAERVAATAWLIFRRFVCFVGALFFVLCAGVAAFYQPAGSSALVRYGSAVALLLAATFCVWVAIFGHRSRWATWRDDVASHRAAKRRYDWRW